MPNASSGLPKSGTHAAQSLAQPQLIGVLPVDPGETIRLPFDPTGIGALLDEAGNLIIISGQQVLVLKGYEAADHQQHVVIIAEDGHAVALTALLAAPPPTVPFSLAPATEDAHLGATFESGVLLTPFAADVDFVPTPAVGDLDPVEHPPGLAPHPLPVEPAPRSIDAIQPAQPVETPPLQARSFTIDANEDGNAVGGAFSAIDIDPTLQGKIAFAVLTLPAVGALVDNGDGTFSFDPGTGFQSLGLGETLIENFRYEASDPAGRVSSASVTIAVHGANDDPSAAAVALGPIDQGASVAGIFQGSDPDAHDKLSYAVTASQVGGLVTNNGDGSFDFDCLTDFDDLAQGQIRTATFDYVATDQHAAASSAATVTIIVQGLNDAPVVDNLSLTAIEDGAPVSGADHGDDVDSDDDSSTLHYAVKAGPAGGLIIDNGDGTFSFDPDGDFQGLAQGETAFTSFAYTATDSHGLSSDIAIVTVTVTGANDAPTANKLSFAATEGAPAIAGKLTGDDIDSDDNVRTLTYVLGGLSGGGTLTDLGGGRFSFDPGSGFEHLQQGATEDVTFTYQTKDSHGALSAPAIVTITVTGSNDAPTAANVNVADTEDAGPVTGSFSGNDVDDAASLSFAIKTAPPQGTVTNNGDGTFTFDPGAGFQDLAAGQKADFSFTYTAKDQFGAESAPATAIVTLTGVNDAPTAPNSFLTEVRHGPPLTHIFKADDVDSDDSQATLTYAITSLPAEGTVANNNDGTFTFDPGSDFDDLGAADSRAVSFTYTATDSHGAVSSTATVTITVYGIDTPPVAGNDSISASEDKAVTVAFNATDHEDDPHEMSYKVISGPAAGTLTVNGDGTFTFDPGSSFQSLAAGASKAVTFTYQATDLEGMSSNVGTVTINVAGVNDAPTTSAVALKATEDGSTVTAKFAADDIDADDTQASLKYTILSSPAEGTVTNNNNGTFSFAPGKAFQDLALGETRDVTLTYQATDKHGATSAPATATVTVTGVNDAPTAAALAVTVHEGSVTPDVAFKGDDADSDDDSDSLVYAVSKQPAKGTVSLNGDGTFFFDPGTNFDYLLAGQSETVTFTYTATDNHNTTSTAATVTVTVLGEDVIAHVEDCPVPSAAILATYEYDPGTTGNDKLDNSNKANHWMEGFAGTDTLSGGALADLIEGGIGGDKLNGQGGNDIILGGADNDTIDGSAGNDCLEGDDGNDAIDGGAGADDLHGEAGNDTLDGRSEDDHLDGGAGNDFLEGDSGDDELHGGDGNDTIDGASDNDAIEGGAGNDTIDGGSGDDVIDGGAGDDIIRLDGGLDRATGGAGNDTIDFGTGDSVAFYNSLGDGRDRLISFDGDPTGTQDVLDLDGLFDSLETNLGPLDTATRTGLVSLSTTGDVTSVFIDADANAATAPVQIATIESNDPITVGADIVVG